MGDIGVAEFERLDLTVHHLRNMSRQGGKVEAHLKDGTEIVGSLGRVGIYAFGVTLRDGSRTSVKHRDVDYVVTELSL